MIDCDLLSLLKGMKDYLKYKGGILINKMVSEILLLLSYSKELIPLMVANVRSNMFKSQGMISFMTDMSRSIKQETD